MVLETLPRSAIILPPPIFSLLGTAHGSILYCRKKTRTFLYANRPRPYVIIYSRIRAVVVRMRNLVGVAGRML